MSLLITLELERTRGRRASKAEKYAVAEKSACWSRRVSSTAERITAVCHTMSVKKLSSHSSSGGRKIPERDIQRFCFKFLHTIEGNVHGAGFEALAT